MKKPQNKFGFFLKFLVLALLVVMIGTSIRAFYRFQNPETSATYDTLELESTLNLKLSKADGKCDPDTSTYKVVYSWESLSAINTWDSFTQTEKFLAPEQLAVVFDQSVDVSSQIKDVPKGTYRVKYKVVQVMSDGRLFRIGDILQSGVFRPDSDGRDADTMVTSVQCK